MAMEARTFTVDATAVPLVPTDSADTNFEVSFKVPAGSTFYVGGPGVTSADGHPLAEGERLNTVCLGDNVVYVATDTGPTDVVVLFQGV